MNSPWRTQFSATYSPPPALVSAQEYVYRNGQRALWHSHEQGQFFYPTQGVVRVLTSEGMGVFPPFKGIWIPPMIEHELHALGDMTGNSVYFEPEAVPDARVDCCAIHIGDGFHDLVLGLLSDTGHRLAKAPPANVITRLHAEIQTARPVLEGWLPLPSDRRLQAICSSLLAHPENDATLEEWSEKAGASPRTLARLFVSETDLTFGQWRQQLRLVEAVARLACGETVTDTAKALGFSSRSAFIAMFKRTLNCPPQHYFGCA